MKRVQSFLAVVVVAVCVCIGGIGQPAHAKGFQKQMQDTFDAMVSVTDPQIVKGATRGVITGGNFTVKTKVMSTDLYSIQFPRIRFGCGGWDIFGGSFSFISSEQIVAMLRSIAANAIAYAFKLALETISDDIANVMDDLWRDGVFSNFMGKSTCEIGAALATAVKDKAAQIFSNQAAANKGVDEGSKDDHTAAQNSGGGRSPASEATQRAINSGDTQAEKAIVPGNHVWEALKSQGSGIWTPFGGDDFIEDVMSIAGTIIVCVPGTHDCKSWEPGTKSGQDDVQVSRRAPLMGLSQLVKGRLQYSVVTKWVCENRDRCMNPKEHKVTNFVGMEELLRKALLGPNEAMGEGLIGRYANNLDPEPNDYGLISAGGTFVSMALNLASRNELDARDYVDTFIELIAAEITYRQINEALTTVLAATSEWRGGTASEVQELVMNARNALREEMIKFYEHNKQNTAKWEYFQYMAQTRPQKTLPGVGVVRR